MDFSLRSPINLSRSSVSPATLEDMLSRIVFIVACLVLPVFWGWLIHALFRYFERQRFSQDDDESIFPDFQI